VLSTAHNIHCGNSGVLLETNIHANIIYGEVAVHAMKSHEGNSPWHSLNMRLDRPHSQSRCSGDKGVAPLRNQTTFPQSASHYTDYTIPAAQTIGNSQSAGVTVAPTLLYYMISQPLRLAAMQQ
jgi:hypothetical protein